MVDNAIKVGFCVAYDWPLLAYSLPLIYERANTICLSIDKDHVSWARRPFDWDEPGFRDLIKAIDTGSKIIVYEDNFHFNDLTPAENEVRQRRLIAERLGRGGWHIQLDCDEYFLDFGAFADFLISQPRRAYRFNVSCQLITIFKEVKDGYLYVQPDNADQFEFLQIASRTPCYHHGRRNDYFNIISDSIIVHQSWARSEEEILRKLSNWGHTDDFNIQEYFEFWKDVNNDNFRQRRNLHPIQPACWPSLKHIRVGSINDLILTFNTSGFPRLPRSRRFWKNSILISRLDSGIRKFLAWTFQ